MVILSDGGMDSLVVSSRQLIYNKMYYHLMLVATLMLIAMSQLQEDKSANPNERAQRALEREQAGKQRNGVSMCIVYTCVCICMHLYACSSTHGDRDVDKSEEGSACARRRNHQQRRK